MKRVVFSKQCDHDIDLAPFWLHWYREIFKADLIILTPVETPRASITETTAFYKNAGLPVIPIKAPKWDDEIIWNQQRWIVANEIKNSNDQFIAFSADADQFFQPLDDDCAGPYAFRRVNLFTNQTPDLSNIEDLRIAAWPSLDLIGGLENDLMDARIGITGHYQGSVKRGPIRWEFHLYCRGFEQFKRKVSGLAVENDGSRTAIHWKRWRSILEQGEDHLVREYQDLLNVGTRISSEEQENYLQLFRQGARRSDPATRIFAPFTSALVFGRSKIEIGASQSVFDLNYPADDYLRLQYVFHEGCYRLPPAINPERVIDIGANIGLFSLVTKAVNEKCQLHAFEPVDAKAQLLSANLAAFGSCTIHQKAVGIEAGQADFFIHPSDHTRDSLVFSPQFNPSPLKVEVINLRQMWELTGFDRCDVLRISVAAATEALLQSLAVAGLPIRCLILGCRSDEELNKLREILSPAFELATIFNRSDGEAVLSFISPQNI